MEIRHLTGIFIRAKVDDKFGSFDISDNSDYNTVESVRKNLYGEPIQQCRQCLATLNMLADVYRISKVPEENS